MMSVKDLFKRELHILLAIIVYNVISPVMHGKKINKVDVGIAGGMINVMRYE